LVAMLVLSATALKMSPSTRLPFAFDDMIHNNLGMSTEEAQFDGSHNVSKDFTSAASILKYIKEQVPWAVEENLKVIAETSADIKEGHIESHYIFQSSVKDSTFKYAIINVIRSNTFKVVVSSEVRSALGINHDNLYHDVRTSVLGLPFGEKLVVSNTDGTDMEEFHEFNKKRLLKSV